MGICADKRGLDCLLYDRGCCTGLYKTDFPNNVCTFFKDVREMSQEDIEIFHSEAWGKNYSSASPEEVTRLTEIGHAIVDELAEHRALNKLTIGQICLEGRRS